MFDVCSSLYPCHRWDCNACLNKRVYWLREQIVAFALELSTSNTYFYTLKGFKTALDAKSAINQHIATAKAEKTRYSAKLEYFYVIANHEFSGWHVHMIANREIHAAAAYCEPCEDVKISGLYLVKNLLKSQHADYAGVRRYGGSSLLNKQNMKKRYATRRRLWNSRTRFKAMKTVIRYLIAVFKCSDPTTDNRQPTTDPTPATPATPNSYRQPTARPPPRNKTSN